MVHQKGAHSQHKLKELSIVTTAKAKQVQEEVPIQEHLLPKHTQTPTRQRVHSDTM